MAFAYVATSAPCVVRKRYCARIILSLLSSAPTWLIMSQRKPSSLAEAALFCAPVQGAFGVGFANETSEYRVGLNFFNPSALPGIVIPTQASPRSIMDSCEKPHI